MKINEIKEKRRNSLSNIIKSHNKEKIVELHNKTLDLLGNIEYKITSSFTVYVGAENLYSYAYDTNHIDEMINALENAKSELQYIKNRKAFGDYEEE